MRSPDAAAEHALSAEERRLLLRVARGSIEHGLATGRALPVDPAAYPPALRELRASFVTLRRRDGSLRGCIGELEATRALVASVADRAHAAAFRDPRFAPLGAHELAAIEVHVSVLGPLSPLPAACEAELLAALRPGVDGLVLDDGVRRATFLPAVWETLRAPERFVGELLRKAGLPAQARWPESLRAWRYGVLELSEDAGG